MSFSYNPLKKLLIDKNIKLEELRKALGLSSATSSKINKNEYVSMEVLDKICNYLNCSIEDVITHIKEGDCNEKS